VNSDKKGWRKRSNSPVCPLSRFSMPPGVVMRKRKSQHRYVVERIARAEAHGLLEVGDSGVRLAIPASHKPMGAESSCTICIEVHGALYHLKSTIEVEPYPKEIEADKGQCDCVVRTQFLQAFGKIQKLGSVFCDVARPFVTPSPSNTTRSAAIGRHEVWIERDRILEMPQGGVVIIRGGWKADMGQASVICRHCINIAGWLSACPLHLGSVDFRRDGSHHLLRHLVLQIEDVVEQPVKTVRPEVRAGRGIARRAAARPA